MSLVHYLYVGRFAREDGHLAFARPGPGEAYRPVVAAPLTPDEVAAAVRKATGGAADTIPADWSAWLDDGYVICDRYTGHPAEVEFVARLAEVGGCDLFDRGGHAELSPAEWRGAHPAADPPRAVAG